MSDDEDFLDDDLFLYQQQEIINGDTNDLSHFLDKYHYMINIIITSVIRQEKMHLLDLILNTYNGDNINDFLYTCNRTDNNDIFIASINIFLSQGADLHYKDDQILSQTFCRDKNDRIIFLINNGCNVNAQNGLIFANICKYGTISTVQTMLTYGVTNDNLNKGLMYAFTLSRFNIMKLLIEYGADVNTLNKHAQKFINADDEALITWLINNDVDPILMILASKKNLII